MIIFVFLFHFRGIFEHIWIGRDEFKLEFKHGSECEHVDQLILLVQLSDVSVTNTNGYS